MTMEKTPDELYGLEPVFEPGADDAASLGGDLDVECPYCGERFSTAVDLSAGSAAYIEDCHVCCQPIEMRLEVGDDGGLAGFHATRIDR